MALREVVADVDLVAYCGLYCGACRQYLREKCNGCRENDKATWCKVRSCGMTKAIATCADCDEFHNPQKCKKFHNIFSRFFGLIFRSDRPASIAYIRNNGRLVYAKRMAEIKRTSIKH